MNEKENSKSSISTGHLTVEHRVLLLTQGRFAIVDAEDYDRLARHRWRTTVSDCTHSGGRTAER